MTPAAGQGCLALEAREDDADAAAARRALTDRAALVELTAERAAIAGPSARAATRRSASAPGSRRTRSRSAASPASPDGCEWVRDRVEGDAAQPAALGEALAERMLAAGAREILDRAERVAG